jgi:hypothetical protein
MYFGAPNSPEPKNDWVVAAYVLSGGSRNGLPFGYPAANPMKENLVMSPSCLSRIALGLIFIAAFGTLGCATTFTGDPHVPGGPGGCIAKCASWRMELIGMVSMGEYSDGCICRIPQRGAANADPASEDGAVAGATAAGAGVFVAMLAAERQRQAAMQH